MCFKNSCFIQIGLYFSCKSENLLILVKLQRLLTQSHWRVASLLTVCLCGSSSMSVNDIITTASLCAAQMMGRQGI